MFPASVLSYFCKAWNHATPVKILADLNKFGPKLMTQIM